VARATEGAAPNQAAKLFGFQTPPNTANSETIVPPTRNRNIAKTPDEAWTKFETEVRLEVEKRFGLFLQTPLNREDALNAMWQGLKTHCWVLDYYFAE
jgi:hypothetical protein